MILTYILFVLAGLISVYSSDIRRFIRIIATVPPNKIRAALRAARLVGYQTELANLKRRHDNVYELVLYVLIELGRMACYIVASGFFGMLLVSAIRINLTFTEIAVVLICYFSVGPFMFAAVFVRFYVELKSLEKYDERVRCLEQKIAALSSNPLR